MKSRSFDFNLFVLNLFWILLHHQLWMTFKLLSYQTLLIILRNLADKWPKWISENQGNSSWYLRFFLSASDILFVVQVIGVISKWCLRSSHTASVYITDMSILWPRLLNSLWDLFWGAITQVSIDSTSGCHK